MITVPGPVTVTAVHGESVSGSGSTTASVQGSAREVPQLVHAASASALHKPSGGKSVVLATQDRLERDRVTQYKTAFST